MPLKSRHRTLQTALDELIDSRHREGVELAALIDQRLDTISEIVVDVRSKLPGILQAQRDNLKTRLEEFKADLDPNRIEQEMVILAQKADVDEEMDRLNTHVQEVKRVLTSKGPIGRRLDFLMQELNREANTLSSKSIVPDHHPKRGRTQSINRADERANTKYPIVFSPVQECLRSPVICL